jgi:N-acetylmuramic acid 6-phosphate etherase
VTTPDPELARLVTEQRNPRTDDIDTLGTYDIVRLINSEDRKVCQAVERELEHISHAVEMIVESLKRGGRLVYVGAGTSGRLGVLDAVECPPTFGTDPEKIVGVVAGGNAAMFHSQEGAEDDQEKGIRDADRLDCGSNDVVCGIAASRRTPFVVSFVARAKQRGARTIYVTTNPRSEFDLDVDVAICPAVGPEVIMGSTRMKSGTAQKLVLNMLTTTAMIRLGKVYENMMVDLQLTNTKLVDRARRIIMAASDVTYESASALLSNAGGHVKTAVVMARTGASAEEAANLLQAADGFVRRAVSLATR